MSLVDVRTGSSLGRGPLSSPLSPPLSSPLDSPLGSPLGAVSLDAAVFVAKGGALGGGMLEDSQLDARADTFSDACGTPSETTSEIPSSSNSSLPVSYNPSYVQGDEATLATSARICASDSSSSIDHKGGQKSPCSPAGSSSCSTYSPSSTPSSDTTCSSPAPVTTTPCVTRSGRETRSVAARVGTERKQACETSRETRTSVARETPSSTSYETRSARKTIRTRRASSCATQPPSPHVESESERSSGGLHSSSNMELDPRDQIAAPVQKPDVEKIGAAVSSVSNSDQSLSEHTQVPSNPLSSPSSISHPPPSSTTEESLPELFKGASSCSGEKTTPSVSSRSDAQNKVSKVLTSCTNEKLYVAPTTGQTTTKVTGLSLACSVPSGSPPGSTTTYKRARLVAACTASTEVTDSLGRKLYVLPSIPSGSKALTVAKNLASFNSSTTDSVYAQLKTCHNQEKLASLTKASGCDTSSKNTKALSSLSHSCDWSLPTSTSSDEPPSQAVLKTAGGIAPTGTTSTLTSVVTSSAENIFKASAESDSPSQTILNPILSKALSPTNATHSSKPPDLKLVSALSNQPATSVSSSEAPHHESSSPKANETALVEPLESVASLTDTTQSTGLGSSRLTAPPTYRDTPRLRTRSVNNTSTPTTSASSLTRMATLRRSASERDSKMGLSDSSSSSLSTATSPGALGLDTMAAPEATPVAPTNLFTESPEDLIDVADALNALGAGDDDGVGSSQDSIGLSGGSSISSCCSGTSSCCGASNFSGSSGSIGSCCSASRQRSRALSPSRLGPQQCQVCSKIFSNASALAKHKLTHSDERRYVCNVCCKAFKRQDHLNGHMLTHRNKKPYECVLEGCNKSYCDARSLRRHEENHHHMRGLPALREKSKEREKEKEARRRNSKTILSLLTTNNDNSGGPNCNNISESTNETSRLDASVSQISTTTTATTTTTTSNTLGVPVSPIGRDIPSSDPKNPQTGDGLPSSTGFSKAPTVVATAAVIAKSTSMPNVNLPKISASPLLASSVANSSNCNNGTITSATIDPSASTKVVASSQTRTSTLRIPQVPPPSPITTPSVHSHITPTRVIATATISSTASLSSRLSQQSAPMPSSPLSSCHDQSLQQLQSSLMQSSNAVSRSLQSCMVRSSNTENHISSRNQAPSIKLNSTMQLNISEARECISQEAQKQTSTRVFNLDSKKQQSEAGLVNDTLPASTSSCTTVSTSTATTTTTFASTRPLTLITTKFPTVPVTLISDGSTNASTVTNTSGISSCKVSSTAHLGSVRNAQSHNNTQSTPLVQAQQIQEDSRNVKLNSVAGNILQTKPVACNLCNRRFKNIPALNGHMRLHGGYFKKESEAKRSDKRESSGPPLQTASVSVRQLIEEKIIQKRGGTIGRVALLAGRDTSVTSSSSVSSTVTKTITVNNATSPTYQTSRGITDRRRLSEQNEPTFRKATSMTSDAVAAANVLQHHNYANNSFPTPPHSTNVSNGNSPPPASASPLSCASFLPLSPQSEGSEPHQLLIHSEDPLLSSTIKDIARKRIDLGSLTVLGSVLVERGGELHLIQAPTSLVQRLGNRNTKQRTISDASANMAASPVIQSSQQAPVYQMTSNFFKADDLDDDVFLGPSIAPDSLLTIHSPSDASGRVSSKIQLCSSSLTKRAPSPTSGQTFSPSTFCAPPTKRTRLSRPYPFHKSRLRSCRREAICSASMPYTPAPMLDPNRNGIGLMGQTGSAWHCSSTTTDGEDSCDALAMSAPESDSFPHVNVGARFQCPIPPCDKKPYTWSAEPDNQDYLLWEPAVVQKCTDAEVDAFLEFACCDAVPGGGRNHEYALHLLHMCDGDIQEAVLQLMQRKPVLPCEHALLSYDYGTTALWNGMEMDAFVKGLSMYSKSWALVSKEVDSKNVKECVQFYYLWKKLCSDEYNNVRTGWKMIEKSEDDMNNNQNVKGDAYLVQTVLGNKSTPKPSKTETDLVSSFAASLQQEANFQLLACKKSNPQLQTKISNELNEVVHTAESKGEMVLWQGDTHEVQCNADTALKAKALEPKILIDRKASQKLESTLLPPEKALSGTSTNSRELNINARINVVTDDSKIAHLPTIKSELKHDEVIEGSSSEALINSETVEVAKGIISEMNDVKLSNLNENSKLLNETFEEAPIIVTKFDHMNDDPNDDVKMEIESMMALHGIKMEEDELSNNSVDDLPMSCKDEPLDVDADEVSDICSCSASSFTDELVSTSTESRLFVCDLNDCSASFNSRAALNGHIRIHGYRKSPPPNVSGGAHRLFSQRQEYPCKTCGKVFGKLKSRSAHMKTHKLTPEQQRADLAESLAGRANEVSSSADIPISNLETSKSLTFSTCPSFGLSLKDTTVSSIITKCDTIASRIVTSPETLRTPSVKEGLGETLGSSEVRDTHDTSEKKIQKTNSSKEDGEIVGQGLVRISTMTVDVLTGVPTGVNLEGNEYPIHNNDLSIAKNDLNSSNLTDVLGEAKSISYSSSVEKLLSTSLSTMDKEESSLLRDFSTQATKSVQYTQTISLHKNSSQSNIDEVIGSLKIVPRKIRAKQKTYVK